MQRVQPSGSVSSTFWSTACSAQLAPGEREAPLEELGEVGGVAELLAEVQEEPVHLPPDRLAQELFLAAREQPVDGGARHTGRRGDVVDGRLGHPAPAMQSYAASSTLRRDSSTGSEPSDSEAEQRVEADGEPGPFAHARGPRAARRA